MICINLLLAQSKRGRALILRLGCNLSFFCWLGWTSRREPPTEMWRFRFLQSRWISSFELGRSLQSRLSHSWALIKLFKIHYFLLKSDPQFYELTTVTEQQISVKPSASFDCSWRPGSIFIFHKTQTEKVPPCRQLVCRPRRHGNAGENRHCAAPSLVHLHLAAVLLLFNISFNLIQQSQWLLWNQEGSQAE